MATKTTTPRSAVEPATTVPLSPAVITVNYQSHDGGTATATLLETGESKALSNGSAVFSDLADGMYTVQLQEILPPETSSDVGIAGQTYIRSHRIAVQAGDHVVIACDDVDCTGIA